MILTYSVSDEKGNEYDVSQQAAFCVAGIVKRKDKRIAELEAQLAYVANCYREAMRTNYSLEQFWCLLHRKDKSMIPAICEHGGE